MIRTLLIIVLGGLLAWLILHLSRTLKEVMPGQPREQSSPLNEKKIIDAEFEDVNEGEKGKGS